MTLDLRTLLQHAAASVREPRDQARWVMNFAAARPARWQALLLFSIISAIFSVILEFIKTGQPVFLLGLMTVTPMVGAMATAANAAITVFIVYWAGRAFGGYGGFGNTIAVIAWLQFILCCILAIQILVAAVMPWMLSMTDLVAMVILFFVFSHFVAELHGFKSALNVFLVTMGIGVGFVMALYAFAAMVSAAVPGAPV